MGIQLLLGLHAQLRFSVAQHFNEVSKVPQEKLNRVEPICRLMLLFTVKLKFELNSTISNDRRNIYFGNSLSRFDKIFHSRQKISSHLILARTFLPPNSPLFCENFLALLGIKTTLLRKMMDPRISPTQNSKGRLYTCCNAEFCKNEF